MAERTLTNVEIRDLIMSVAAASTVPLLSPRKGGGFSLGSGVLVRLADWAWIFTAAHVVEEGAEGMQADGIPLAGHSAIVSTSPAARGREGRFKRDDEPRFPTRAGDYTDIGIIKISSELVSQLQAKGRAFLQKDRLWLPPEKEGARTDLRSQQGRLALWGFPTQNAMRQGDLVRPLPAFLTLPHREEEIQHPWGFSLHYPPGKKWHFVGSTSESDVFEPGGLSGCGVWSFPDVCLTGIQHTWVPGDALRVTMLPEYFERLKQEEGPEFTRALSVQIPKARWS